MTTFPINVHISTYEALAARVRREDGAQLAPPLRIYEDGTCDLALEESLLYRLHAFAKPGETLEAVMLRVIWTAPRRRPSEDGGGYVTVH